MKTINTIEDEIRRAKTTADKLGITEFTIYKITYLNDELCGTCIVYTGATQNLYERMEEISPTSSYEIVKIFVKENGEWQETVAIA